MPKRAAKQGTVLPLAATGGKPESETEESEPKPKSYSVGTRIVCSEEDAATLRAVIGPLTELHQRLGALREDFLRRESVLLRDIGQARENYTNTAVAIGRKKGINLGPGSTEVWTFNPDEAAFIRTA